MVKKLEYIFAMTYHSAINRNKLVIRAIICMSLQGIMLSEKRPCQKITVAWFPTYGILEKPSFVEMENIFAVARDGSLWEGFECGYERATRGIYATIELFCILIFSVVGYMNLHVIKLHRTKYTYTYVHARTRASKTKELWIK